jgi:hypothetical protein
MYGGERQEDLLFLCDTLICCMYIPFHELHDTLCVRVDALTSSTQKLKLMRKVANPLIHFNTHTHV